MLRATCLLGAAAGLAMVVGGPWLAQPAAWVAWLTLLTLDAAVDLNYPWDCLLFEAGALALALPPTLPLPAIAAASPPSPLIRWAFRWLVFRVLFGFGKLKFIGSGPKDSCYVKSFCIGMPLPTPAGWSACRRALHCRIPPPSRVTAPAKTAAAAASSDGGGCRMNPPARGQVRAPPAAGAAPTRTCWDVRGRDTPAVRALLHWAASAPRRSWDHWPAGRHTAHRQLWVHMASITFNGLALQSHALQSHCEPIAGPSIGG